MTDEGRMAVMNGGAFYQVTPEKNWDSIKTSGLDPARSDWFMYASWLKHPAIFLCTRAALAQAKRMFDNGLDRVRRVVLKVPAAAVLEHACDVDYSFPDCTKGLTFLECLRHLGFIVCFGTIAPGALEVVERYDDGKLPAWDEACRRS